MLSETTSSEQGNKCCLLSHTPAPLHLHALWMPELDLGRARTAMCLRPLCDPHPARIQVEKQASSNALLRFQGGSQQTPSNAFQLRLHLSTALPTMARRLGCHLPACAGDHSSVQGAAWHLGCLIPPPPSTLSLFSAYGPACLGDVCTLVRGRGPTAACYSTSRGFPLCNPPRAVTLSEAVEAIIGCSHTESLVEVLVPRGGPQGSGHPVGSRAA